MCRPGNDAQTNRHTRGGLHNNLCRSTEMACRASGSFLHIDEQTLLTPGHISGSFLVTPHLMSNRHVVHPEINIVPSINIQGYLMLYEYILLLV